MLHRPQKAVTGKALPEVKTSPDPGQELTRHPGITDAGVTTHQDASTGESATGAASTMVVPDTPKSTEHKLITDAPFTPMKGNRGIQRLFAKFKRKLNDSKDEKSFAGGAALRNTASKPAHTSPHEYDSSSIGSFLELDVEEHDEDGERPGSRVSGVTEGSDEFEEARDVFDDGLAPPPTFVTEGKKTGNSVRDTRFHEEL